MSRKDDERLYQPASHSRWIRQLYRIGEETGLPMTVLLDEAMRAYCTAHAEGQGTREAAVRGEPPLGANSEQLIAHVQEQ